MDVLVKKQYNNLDEVIQRLDGILDETIVENSYLGVFAYVYLMTTIEIRNEVNIGGFEDNERMMAFDIVFAELFIEAYQNYKMGKPISQSWEVVFEVQHEKITLIQHLMLGMNAHINLDLGIAASRISVGEGIASLKNDFMKVNKILAGLIDQMQRKLSTVSWLMVLLDWIGNRNNEKIINFSMVKARQNAWNNACKLASDKEEDRPERINNIDQNVVCLAETIYNPPSILLKGILKLIGWFEIKDVERIVFHLRDEEVII